MAAPGFAVSQDTVCQCGTQLAEQRFSMGILAFSNDLFCRNAGVPLHAVVPDDHPSLAVEDERRLLEVVEDAHGYLAAIHGLPDSFLLCFHTHHPGTVLVPQCREKALSPGSPGWSFVPADTMPPA